MQMPYGSEPWGSGTTWRSAPVIGSRMLIEGCCWLTTQIVPSAAWARVRGFFPTGFSKTKAWVVESMADTVSWSGFTHHTLWFVESRMIVDDAVGLIGLTG